MNEFKWEYGNFNADSAADENSPIMNVPLIIETFDEWTENGKYNDVLLAFYTGDVLLAFYTGSEFIASGIKSEETIAIKEERVYRWAYLPDEYND